LLGYYTPDGRLIYAGRVGTGMSEKTLRMLHAKLSPLAVTAMPLAEKPPRKSRFGSPLQLSRVHWVKPKLVAEVTYLTCTADNLLRHSVFVGLREDKPAQEVRKEIAMRSTTRALLGPLGKSYWRGLLPLVIQPSSPDPLYERRKIEDANWDSALGFAIHFRLNLKADADDDEHPRAKRYNRQIISL
jgi:ATP dependent DNA ligase C terminal region